jgi:hypothetical protein
MACEDIAKGLATLRSEKKELEALLPNLGGAGLQAVQANIATKAAQIEVEQDRLDECRALAEAAANPPPRRPFTARVKQIHCAAAGAEIGDQEPYLLIATVDRTPGFLSIPALHCVLVGPWADMRAGYTRFANAGSPAFWDLDEDRKIVADPQHVIFLVGVVENDGASPDAIRSLVQTSLLASLAQNLQRDYDTLANTLASAMTGAIDSFRGAGIGPGNANFDDRVGVGRLNLTDYDLDRIDALRAHEKALTITGRNGSGNITDQYTVTVSFAA